MNLGDILHERYELETILGQGGMGITYNIAASLFAGTTPLIADLLVNATHGAAISPFMPALWIIAKTRFASLLATA